MRAWPFFVLSATASCGLSMSGLSDQAADTIFPGGGADAESFEGGSSDATTTGAGADAAAEAAAVDAGEGEGGHVQEAGDATAALDAAGGADGGGATGIGDATGADADSGVQAETGDATTDGGTVDVAEDEATAATTCVDSLPSGWTVAIYDLGPDACPAVFAEHDVLGAPAIGSGACTCSCTVGESGSCEDGMLDVAVGHGSGTDMCSTALFSGAVSDAGCTPLNAAVPLQPMTNLQASPLAPTGGTCSGSLTADPTQLSAPSATYCDVPTADAESVCEGTVPSGFAACIASPGVNACPAGTPFVHAYTVEDAATLQCTDCTACAVSTTCSDAGVTLFGDPMCLMAAAGAAPADGSCNSLGAHLATVAAFTYAASATSSCTAGVSTASPTLTNPRTLCCR